MKVLDRCQWPLIRLYVHSWNSLFFLSNSFKVSNSYLEIHIWYELNPPRHLGLKCCWNLILLQVTTEACSLFRENKNTPPQVLPCVHPTLVETLLNPSWKLCSGISKDEIERLLVQYFEMSCYMAWLNWCSSPSGLKFDKDYCGVQQISIQSVATLDILSFVSIATLISRSSGKFEGVVAICACRGHSKKIQAWYGPRFNQKLVKEHWSP